MRLTSCLRNLKSVSSPAGLLTLLLAVGALTAPSMSAADPPIHQVRGHAIWDLNPPRGLINQISINAWQDESGANGVVRWTTDFDLIGGTGWTWGIVVHTLFVDGNQAYVQGTIVFDNRFPENEGLEVGFFVTDNGQGPNDPPDELDGFPLLGGNLTVR